MLNVESILNKAASAIEEQLKTLSMASLTSISGCFEGTNADAKLKRMSVFFYGTDMNRVSHFENALSVVKEWAEGILLYATSRADAQSTPENPYNFAILKNMIEQAKCFVRGQESEKAAREEVERAARDSMS